MKKWYASKTVWVNLLALVGMALETVTGKQVLDPDTQGVILTVINLILRFVTKQGLTFKDVVDVIKPDAAAPAPAKADPGPAAPATEAPAPGPQS